MAINNIDLKSLKLFVEVIQRGSVRQAAEQLGLSQPSAQERVQKLQKAIGKTLFVSKGKRLYPTEEALQLHSQLAIHLSKMEDLLFTEEETANNELHLMLPSYIIDIALPHVVDVISSRDRPGTLTITQIPDHSIWLPSYADIITQHLSKGIVDLVIFHDTSLFEPFDNVKKQSLFSKQDEWVCLYDSTFNQFKSTKIDLRKIDAPLILLKDHRFSTLKQQLKQTLQMDSYSAMLNMVTGSHLVALVPERIARNWIRHNQQINMIALTNKFQKLQHFQFWSEYRNLDADNTWIRRILRNVCQQL